MNSRIISIFAVAICYCGAAFGQDLYPTVPNVLLRQKGVIKINETTHRLGEANSDVVFSEYLYDEEGRLKQRNQYLDEVVMIKEMFTYQDDRLDQVMTYTSDMFQNNDKQLVAQKDNGQEVRAGASRGNQSMSLAQDTHYTYDDGGQLAKVESRLLKTFCVKRCTEKFSAFSAAEFEAQAAKSTSNPKTVYDCTKSSELRTCEYHSYSDSTVVVCSIDNQFSGSKTMIVHNQRVAGYKVTNYRGEDTRKMVYEYNKNGTIKNKIAVLRGGNAFDFNDNPVDEFDHIEYGYDSGGRLSEEKYMLKDQLQFTTRFVYVTR